MLEKRAPAVMDALRKVACLPPLSTPLFRNFLLKQAKQRFKESHRTTRAWSRAGWPGWGSQNGAPAKRGRSAEPPYSVVDILVLNWRARQDSNL